MKYATDCAPEILQRQLFEIRSSEAKISVNSAFASSGATGRVHSISLPSSFHSDAAGRCGVTGGG
jgi:hypothetical protein